MNELCDICGIRPVTHRVQVTQNGQMAELNVCDIDYQRLRQQAGSSSPFESLFSGSNPFNSFEQAFARPERQQAAGLEALLSDTAKDIIQEAGNLTRLWLPLPLNIDYQQLKSLNSNTGNYDELYQSDFDTIVNNIANGYLKYLGME